MTLYTLQWQNDTTNQTQEVGSYNTLPEAVACVQSMFGKRLCRWQIITDQTFVEA